MKSMDQIDHNTFVKEQQSEFNDLSKKSFATIMENYPFNLRIENIKKINHLNKIREKLKSQDDNKHSDNNLKLFQNKITNRGKSNIGTKSYSNFNLNINKKQHHTKFSDYKSYLSSKLKELLEPIENIKYPHFHLFKKYQQIKFSPNYNKLKNDRFKKLVKNENTKSRIEMTTFYKQILDEINCQIWNLPDRENFMAKLKSEISFINEVFLIYALKNRRNSKVDIIKLENQYDKILEIRKKLVEMEKESRNIQIEAEIYEKSIRDHNKQNEQLKKIQKKKSKENTPSFLRNNYSNDYQINVNQPSRAVGSSYNVDFFNQVLQNQVKLHKSFSKQMNNHNDYSKLEYEKNIYSKKLNNIITGIKTLNSSNIKRSITNSKIYTKENQQIRRMRTISYGKWYLPVSKFNKSIYHSIFD